MSKLTELKQEAKELGIAFNPNIGEARLAEKIEEHYQAKSVPTTTTAPEKDEVITAAEQKALTVAQQAKILAREREKAARKTRVITIIDNDQRTNNHTTTCTVNCSNTHFDLGQVVLPLNMAVEVKQGHIDVLKELDIVQHVRGKKGELAQHVLRKRYTISYEDTANSNNT